MTKRRRAITPRADINVTPFIDILLVLLVIFMTISPTTPAGLDAAIPQPAPAKVQHQTPTQPIVLSMDRFGAMKINGQDVQAGQLATRLQDIFKARRERVLFLQADNELLFSDVAQVIDLAKGAGVDRLAVMPQAQ